jgi:30S ribosomal protein S31
MGKGDQRSRRGKIHRGTFGRRRPKKKNITKSQSHLVAPPPKTAEKTESE